VTQRPVTSRQDRVSRHIEIVNASRSSWEARFRFWLMHFNLLNLSLSFLAVYVVLNVIFAGLFFIDDDKCCGNPDTTFGEVFAFCVQTSATIGYGAMAPSGAVSNFLVLMLSFLATLISTLFAGLLFTKFVTPVVKIQFADVMTLCNVNGVPCLTVRIGNADGYENRLTDINVRLSYSYQIPYVDHKGEKRTFGQTDELKLLSSRQHGLLECWHLRHVVDENSPLFGLNFEEHPANKIHLFTLSVDAVQNLTKSSVNGICARRYFDWTQFQTARRF
jgi:inward rectifier potassium channel